MTTTAIDIRLRPLAILSLLGDGPSPDTLTREYRGRPVLARTIERIRAAESDPMLAILAWDDQLKELRSRLGDDPAIQSAGPRRISPQLNITNASLRWADGWRGGLLGVCAFDRGFDAQAILGSLATHNCDAALLVDASAALIEPGAIDALIGHLADRPLLEYAFLPGTPGSGAMLLRIDTIRELNKASRSPGQLLAYHPDRPIHDPLAKEQAVPVSPRVARSLTRLAVDSDRQLARLSLAQIDSLSVDSLIERIQNDTTVDATPREVIVELTTRRATRPTFSILSTQPVERPEMTVERAKQIFGQLASIDDIRLTFAGVGDPLLHGSFDQILKCAKDAGLCAIHVETDLLAERREYVELIADGTVDVVSVHLPAVHRDTYREMMGVDRVQDVLEQLRQLVTTRARIGRGVPIVVPIFTKCERNLGEMEAWYDQWIRAVGAAVIRGPSDFGGAIPYIGVSDMLPPVRRPCRRLRSRMTILSDGTFASCEEDVFARQAVGAIDRSTIESAWTEAMRSLRMRIEGSVCSRCRMWDRP